MSIEATLKTQGYVVLPIMGVSMLPLLKQGKDTVTVRPLPQKVKTGQVILFKRNEKLVLHRVTKILSSGCYIQGDNCPQGEFVAYEKMIGVMTEYSKKGNVKQGDGSALYKNILLPLWRIKVKIRALLSKIKHKIFK